MSHDDIGDSSNPHGGSEAFKLHSVISNQSSYLLSLGYSEQLSAATHTMLQLGTLAHDLDAHLVETTMVSSHFFGIRGIYPDYVDLKSPGSEDVNLFYAYDASKVNKALHLGISPSVSMVSFEHFLNNAPRKITIFHFNTRSRDKARNLFSLSQSEVERLDAAFEENTEEKILDCLTRKMPVMNEYINKIEHQLNSWAGKEPFHVFQALCLNPNPVYRSDHLSGLVPSPRTIIFTNWGGCAVGDCSYLSKANRFRTNRNSTRKSNIRHAVLTEKRFKHKIVDEHELHHDRLHSLAREYLAFINFTSSSYIAIHIRMERVIRYALEHKTRDYDVKCVADLLSTVRHILNGSTDIKPRGSPQVLVMSDMPGSGYGSDSCSGWYCKEGEVRKLYSAFNAVFDFHSFQPKIVNVPSNSGLVSLVEMHMLSMGKKLVLVGYGGFQAVLKGLFLSQGHSVNDIHHVQCQY